ncbi:hypothetical protein ES703_21918 [subsurface metagenome]
MSEDIGKAIQTGMRAMREGLREGLRGMRIGLGKMGTGMGEGRKACNGSGTGFTEEEGEMGEDAGKSWWSNLGEGINISLDVSGLIFGFLSLGLGIGAFFLYLIPFVLVLSWPFAIAGLIVGLVAVLNFRVGWFRGFVPGLVGLGLSGAVLWFHLMNLIWTTGTLDYMLGLWGPPPGW